MMKSEFAPTKIPHCNLGGVMIGSHPLICKNDEEEDDDDGDSVSSKLDLHFSKEDVIDDDDEDFRNFDSLKPRDQNYISKVQVDLENCHAEDDNNGKLSSISQEIKRNNTNVRKKPMITE